VSLRFSKGWALVLLLAVALAIALFFLFVARFGGPQLRLEQPYELSANVDDTRGLVVRSEVLARGVPVGVVESIDPVTVGGGGGEGEDGAEAARVTFSIDGQYAPLGQATTVRVGAKTLFGESYIDLVPGGGKELPAGGEIAAANVLPEAVDVDQALEILDDDGRKHLQALLATAGEATAPAGSGERINETIAAGAELTGELRRLAGTLRGQRSTLAGLVSDGATVAGELGDREQTLRSIVTGADTTLNALAARTDSLEQGMEELPPLLETGRAALAEARPLLEEATPLAADVADASPVLREAIDLLPPIAGDVDHLLAAAPELERASGPFLTEVGAALEAARPATGPLQAALRNAEPVANYLSERKRPFAAWFSNTGDLGSSRDAKGYFARFFVGFEPGTGLGLPGGNYESNAYTGPDDALDPQPYSGYPRLLPYDPGVSRLISPPILHSSPNPNQEDDR